MQNVLIQKAELPFCEAKRKTGSDQAGFMIIKPLGLKYGPFLLLKRCFGYQKDRRQFCRW